MRRFGLFLLGIAMARCVFAPISSASGQSAGDASSIFITKIPAGYRDWKLISVAHEEANLNSFAAVLGNDVAIKAYREEKLPFPDGAIIAALHYRFVPSEENNKALASLNLSLPGTPPTFSSWLRTQRRTPGPEDGDSVTSTRTAHLPARRCSKPARLATRRLRAISSSPVTHVDRRSRIGIPFSLRADAWSDFPVAPH
jgi:Cytochrome P460